jgi:hypothetical protein
MSKCKTTVLTFEEFTDDDYRKPSNFYIMDALQNYVFFHTRDRLVAQEWCDKIYDGAYTVNASKMGKKPESESAVGRMNTKSRMNSKGAPR